MTYKVMGVQRHVKWAYQGKTGVNQRLHVVGFEQMINRESDDDNEGRIVENIKVPLRCDLSHVHANDFVEIYYNRYGQVDIVKKVDKPS